MSMIESGCQRFEERESYQSLRLCPQISGEHSRVTALELANALVNPTFRSLMLLLAIS